MALIHNYHSRWCDGLQATMYCLAALVWTGLSAWCDSWSSHVQTWPTMASHVAVACNNQSFKGQLGPSQRSQGQPQPSSSSQGQPELARVSATMALDVLVWTGCWPWITSRDMQWLVQARLHWLCRPLVSLCVLNLDVHAMGVTGHGCTGPGKSWLAMAGLVGHHWP